MDSSLTPLIDAFRQRYPDASFTTDLIAVEAGQFVVRSQIRLPNNTHISALAADLTLETAEDRACLRVLQKLGLANSLTATPEPQPIAKAAPDQAKAPVPLHRPSVIATAEVPASQPKPVTTVDLPFPLFEAEPNDDSPSSELPAAPEQPTAAASPSFPQAAPAPVPPVTPDVEPSLFDPQPPTSEPPDVPQANPVPNDKPKPAATPQLDLPESDNPIDLSDIIAQTDVELRRLGWTVGQGRDFLEKTYGKRSRHDLTDEELLEFLLYLESQTATIEG